MSKINQIQTELGSIGAAAFQKLADAYLYKQGYEEVDTVGSVVGADKVRTGTPDSLILRPNGKYVFVEHTTTQNDVFGKLQDDLEKCFDENKTGISVEKIEEVVFCHTSTLSPEEADTLIEECAGRGVNLNVFGISRIAQDLYLKFPALARDFLGVEVDTGQIVGPDDFVEAYNKSKLAAPLDTSFRFREEEAEQVVAGLEGNGLSIVTGAAGTGKTRLALEACTRFRKAHPKCKVWCVFDLGDDMHEDLRTYLAEPGEHLLLVDDANRIKSFGFIVHLLLNQREDQKISVVATVRDYALRKVRETAKPVGGGVEVEVGELTDEQIRNLVEEEFAISHTMAQRQIAEIAKGNARLAVMAAQVAKEEGTLQSISDVSALYDEYFRSVRKDLNDLGGTDLLKVVGIISFFRAVDRFNDELTEAIEEAFDIPLDAFWEAVRRLHDMEIVDMHEDDVVRIPDQVLSTYFFYLAFFREQVLDFSALLEHFFPSQEHRITDALYPAMTAFDQEALEKVMRPCVDQVWGKLEEARNEKELLRLASAFWFLKQTDTLVYVREQIIQMEPESVEPSEWSLATDSNIPEPSLLDVLSSFRFVPSGTLGKVIHLLLSYLEKRPSDLPKAVHLLTDKYGFREDSWARGYTLQKTVLDVVWQRARQGEHELFSKLFLAVAKVYLHTQFNTTRMGRGQTIRMIRFELPPVEEVFQLREEIWNRVFRLFEMPSLQAYVLEMLQDYSTSGYRVSSDEIIAKDAAAVLSFIEESLSPDSFDHCRVAHDYLTLLEKRSVPFDENLRNHFRNDTYDFSKLILHDREERIELGYEEYRTLREKRLEDYTESFDLDDYEELFEHCRTLRERLDEEHEKLQLARSVTNILTSLAERDADLYAKTVEHYLGLGDPLKLRAPVLVQNLIDAQGRNKAHETLSRYNYETKERWLFNFYGTLTPEEIAETDLEHIYFLLHEAKGENLPQSLDFLLKYRTIDEGSIARATRILLKRTGAENFFPFSLNLLFNPHTEPNEQLRELFRGESNLLKRAYFACLEMSQHGDYDGKTFDLLLDLDPSFIEEYIDWIYKREKWPSAHSDTRDYAFLWLRKDHEKIMDRAIRRIDEREEDGLFFGGSFLSSFFTLTEGKDRNTGIEKRQDDFLTRFIEQHHGDRSLMTLIFELIVGFSDQRSYSHLSTFLERNKNYEDFELLPLLPNGASSVGGSFVPVYRSRIDYLKSLLPLVDTVDFLKHEQRIEQRIQSLEARVENEKKREFLRI